MVVNEKHEGEAIAKPASNLFQATLSQSLKKTVPSLPCSPQTAFEQPFLVPV